MIFHIPSLDFFSLFSFAQHFYNMGFKILAFLCALVASTMAYPCVDCGNSGGAHRNNVGSSVGDHVDHGNNGGDHANNVGVGPVGTIVTGLHPAAVVAAPAQVVAAPAPAQVVVAPAPAPAQVVAVPAPAVVPVPAGQVNVNNGVDNQNLSGQHSNVVH